MIIQKLIYPAIIVLVSACSGTPSLNVSQQPDDKTETEVKKEAFRERWSYISETSAVIYWQLEDISLAANSFIEYGRTQKLGMQTQVTTKPRWAQLHWLKNLEPGSVYFYRMINIDPESHKKTASEIIRITPEKKNDAIRIPGDLKGSSPYVLNKKDSFYILTKDIITDGTAIEIAAEGVTLDLDGHTIKFGNNTSEQVYGVRFADPGRSKLCNGFIVQGNRSRDYSAAIASLDRPTPTEISAIATDVHPPNAFPITMTHANIADIHHNHFFSRVTELESRHYPGNALIRVYSYDGNIHIHNNLLTEGCHWGILIKVTGGRSEKIEVDNNDIRHHMQYVNGYAISPGSGARVHHNKITSTGRALHLTGEGTECYNNYIDIKGHQDLCDLPARTRPFYHRLIELHGIKLEGSSVKNSKIYNNFVRIIQYLPVDSGGRGDPLNKIENGVYIRSRTSSIDKDKLTDITQKWAKDRWKYYFVKYDPDLPPAMITGNDATSLSGEFGKVKPSEYTIYMKWVYVPATPLNLACYDPDAMNEIYGNTFIGITHYKNTRNGTEYGDSGEWATAIMFIAMTNGPASPGKYSAWLHDNHFFSNDLFFNSGGYKINMTIRMTDNTFTLLREPFATKRTSRIYNVGPVLEKQISENKNTFIE